MCRVLFRVANETIEKENKVRYTCLLLAILLVIVEFKNGEIKKFEGKILCKDGMFVVYDPNQRQSGQPYGSEPKAVINSYEIRYMEST